MATIIKTENELFTISNIGFDPNQLNETPHICEICGNKFTDKVKIAVHYVINHNLQYCSMCTLLFTNVYDKLEHETIAHVPLKCSICLLKFDEIPLLKEHLTLMHGVILCGLCSTQIKPIDDYGKHLNRRHHVQDMQNITELFRMNEDAETFLCLICTKERPKTNIFGHFIHYHKMARNALLDHTIKYIGLFTVDGATSETNKSYREIDPSITCTVCEQAFNSDGTRNIHDVFCKGYKICGECTKIYANLKQLIKHKIEKHKTAVCKFGCTGKINISEMSSHISLIHNLYICTLCDKTLSNQKYSDHLKEIHNVDLEICNNYFNNSKLYQPNKDETQKMSCNLCNNDITELINNTNSLVTYYKSNHGCTQNSLLKIFSENLHNAKSKPQDLSQHFKITDVPRDSTDTINGILDFNAKLVHCIASSEEETTDDESSASKPRKCRKICKFCDTKTVTWKSLMIHMNKLHGFVVKNIEPRCNICRVVFSNKSALQRHNFQKHSITALKTKNRVNCPFCDEILFGRCQFRKHVSQHVDMIETNCTAELMGFCCRYCPSRFWTIDQKNVHQLEAHLVELGDSFILCNQCGGNFSNKSSLRIHTANTHSDQQQINYILYKCSICKIAYSSLDEIRVHMLKVHPKDTAFYCDQNLCKLRFDDFATLLSHKTETHKICTTSTENEFECKTCQEIYTTEHIALLHYQICPPIHHITNNRTFKCRLCKRKFSTLDNRKIHYIADHPNEDIYKCSICNKGFRTKNFHISHLPTHTNECHTCPVCNKSFYNRTYYNDHLMIHQEPRHNCSYCPKMFVQRSNLLRHIRTHTGEKPYKCSHCDKKFSDIGACKSHERIHSSDSLFECAYCGKAYTQKSNLSQHFQLHIEENLNSDSWTYYKLDHGSGHEIKCPHCTKMFRHRSNLTQHIKFKHTHPKYFCLVCNEQCSSKRILRKHMFHSHKQKKHFECGLCNFKCTSKAYIRNHLVKKHGMKKDNVHQHILNVTPKLVTTSDNFEISMITIKEEPPYNINEGEYLAC